MKTYYVGNMPVSDELYHHGIKGQKWGIRRYQNPDGTLTAAGKARYAEEDSKSYIKNKKGENVWDREKYDEAYNSLTNRLGNDVVNKLSNEWGPTLDDVYRENYRDFSKKEQEKISKGMETLSELSRKSQEIFREVRESEAKRLAPNAIKAMFGSDKKTRERAAQVFRSASEIVNKRKDYQELSKQIQSISNSLTKARGTYKDISMQKILNKLPADKRDDAYVLMRYYWWEAD